MKTANSSPLDILTIHNAWEYQWKVIHSLFKGLPEPEASKAYSFAEKMSWAFPWPTIFEIQKVWNESNSNVLQTWDSVEVLKSFFEKSYHKMSGIKKVLEDMQKYSKELVQIMQSMENNSQLQTECHRMYEIGGKAYEYLSAMDATLDEAKKRLENTAPNVQQNVNVEFMSAREKENAINAVLDAFNKNQIDKSQMEAKMTEFAKKTPNRMITGFGSIKL